MKKITFFAICFTALAGFHTFAQTDVTDTYLENPSFETGDNTGWTITGADDAAWLGPNDDGDETKGGTYITGIWNNPIGDVEWKQSLTGLPNGTYTVKCLMTVSNHSRMSTQRLFANEKSILYGSESDYVAGDISILEESETLSYAEIDTVGTENGPFHSVEISVEVTDGTLDLGLRVNGAGSANAFSFQGNETDIGFFKWDNMTLISESVTSVNDIEELGAKVYALNSAINVEVEETATVNVYSISGSLLNSVVVNGVASIPVSKGLFIVSVNGATTKVAIE